jgi:hypothetical protein
MELSPLKVVVPSCFDITIILQLLNLERKIIIDIASIQKLLRKALLYRLMANLDKTVSNAGLSHQEISSRTGRQGNWFNDAYNNNEDIHISSLSKILSVVNEHTEINQYRLTDIFDEKVLRISIVMSTLADEQRKNKEKDKENTDIIKNFIIAEIDLFLDLLGDWGSLIAKKKLNDNELVYFEKLQSLIKQLANEEDKSNG